MKNGKEIVSILGKPNSLMTFVWYIGVSGIGYSLLKNPIFNNKLYDYPLIFGVFTVMAVVGVLFSKRAKKENRELEIERGLREKELEEYKAMLAINSEKEKAILATNLEKEKATIATNLEKQVSIKEATDKIFSWIENPSVVIAEGKFHLGNGISIEVKVLQTCKYAITRDDGRQIAKVKLT